MYNKNLNVIIIGGGIGGLCLAQGLKKAGIHFTVFERNKDNDTWLEGYRIHINPTGSSALHECLPENLWQAFLAGTADEKEGFAFMTEQLKELVFIDAAMMIGYSLTPERGQYAAGRKMLRQVLQSGLDKQIVYNKTFSRYKQDENGKLKVFFEDGSSVTGDVLIGADGANSKLRSQLLPGAKRITTDAVAIAGRTLLNEDTRAWLPDALLTRMNVIMPLKKYFFFTAAFDHQQKKSKFNKEIKEAAVNAGIDPEAFFETKENYVLWAFIAHKKEFSLEPQNKIDDLKNTVLTKIDSWHTGLKGLVKQSDPATLIFLPFKVMMPIKNWKAGNITILGDAVHNMPPLYGMGANMALHDAALLTRELEKVNRGDKELSKSLQDFQDQMIRDGFDALDISMKYTKQAISYNSTRRFLSRLWFRLCASVPAIKELSFGKRWTA